MMKTVQVLSASGLVGILLVNAGCGKGCGANVSADQVRTLANDLYNRGLYEQAIREYEDYLREYHPKAGEQGNINYLIGEIYFERLKDYRNALAYYLRVKHLYPQSPVQGDVDRRIVECLERLQRSADAQQALEEATAIDTSQVRKARPGVVVAKIANRTVTQGDLDFEINQLPPYLRNQFTSKEKKLEFLKDYVATELLYDTARRKGLDRDKDVLAAAFDAKKKIMVQKLLQEEIVSEVGPIKDVDVELYYKANKEKYAEKDEKGKVKRQKPLEEVRQQVYQDLVRERQQRAYEELIQRMMRAEEVQIYADQVQ